MLLLNEDFQMTTVKVDIAKDFTQFPGGRYRTHGPGSGQEFREDRLAPAMNSGFVEVELSGVYGYPASFLEEAFGGLIRSGWTLADIRKTLTLKASDPNYQVYVEQAWQFMEDESQRQQAKR